MKESPITFNGPMIRAIIGGRKTQSRSIIKLPIIGSILGPNIDGREINAELEGGGLIHPYGKPGDLLWVRETFAELYPSFCGCSEPCLCGDGGYIYRATNSTFETKWKPPISMPRLASRLTLLITGVRVERLNEIGEQDAIAEGVSSASKNGGILTKYAKPSLISAGDRWKEFHESPVSAFADMWKSENGTRSWEENPLVGVTEFHVIKKNIDDVLRGPA